MIFVNFYGDFLVGSLKHMQLFSSFFADLFSSCFLNMVQRRLYLGAKYCSYCRKHVLVSLPL